MDEKGEDKKETQLKTVEVEENREIKANRPNWTRLYFNFSMEGGGLSTILVPGRCR